MRDANGRFASTPGGGGGSKRPKARMAEKGPNRLTRDNAGKITSQGGNGATVRGGRLRTAGGNLRGRVLAKGPKQAGVIKARRPATLQATPIKPRVPASQRPGSITNTLKNTLRSLAQSDAKRIREVEAITGQPVRAPKRPPAGSGATVRPSGRRSVSGTLGDNLRSLAKSDARYYRELADLAKAPPAKGLKGGKGQGRALGGQKKALAGGTESNKKSKALAKPDLSQGAFERRAKATEKRAKAAERDLAAVDRYNPSNRRLVNRANSLRSAADSYASYARRGKTDPDFSAAYLFQRRTKSTTAPKLTRSEKAAATRRKNADKRFYENVRKMEQARRYG